MHKEKPSGYAKCARKEKSFQIRKKLLDFWHKIGIIKSVLGAQR
jgi:hypothetical protein